MPELLGRRGIGLPPTGAKTNELIARHVHTRGFVLVYTSIVCYVVLVTTGQYKTRTAVGKPHLARSSRLIPESVFFTKSVMLSPHFIPQSVVIKQRYLDSIALKLRQDLGRILSSLQGYSF